MQIKINPQRQMNFSAIKNDAYDPHYYGFAARPNGYMPDLKVIKTALLELPDREKSYADIGAGDGRITIPLAKKGYKMTAYELSQRGRNNIKEHAKLSGLSNVIVQEDDILNGPFKQKFDGAFMVHVSQHFTGEELERVTKNVAASLKKGGFFLFDALLEKSRNIEPNNADDIKCGYCHFPLSMIRRFAKWYGFAVANIELYNEEKACRGHYYHNKWGFNMFVGEKVRPVVLKWITLKKL